jgi:tripartite-type tricarboxylate transporter receptor subunit TctC
MLAHRSALPTLLRKLVYAVVFPAALAPAHAAAPAKDYPTRPVRLIVPQPPGGGTDIVARLVAPRLSEELKQQVIVDNRAGAGGIVGSEIAARAPADGYTLLLGYTGNLTVNPHLHRKLPYRPLQDFDPVSLAVSSPFVLAVDRALAIENLKDLIAKANAASVPLNYASPGNGSLHHLAMEWLKSAAGLRVTHVPYKGSAASLAVVTGEVSVSFVSILNALPHVKSGRMKAIAVSSRERSRALPELPTIEQSGVSGFEAANWFGIVVPRGTDGAVVSRLSAIIAAHMRSDVVKQRLIAGGADAIGSTPAEFGRIIAAEYKRWEAVVKHAGLTVD